MLLALTLGDVTGVGPEVAAKALDSLRSSADPVRIVVFGDRSRWADALARHAPSLAPGAFAPWNPGATTQAPLSFHDDGIALPADLAPADPRAGDAALRWVRAATHACRAGHVDAMVTGPLNKESVVKAGHAGFTGQTEYIAGLLGRRDQGMMLLGHDEAGRWLRVALVTTHLPLRDVPGAIDADGVLRSITLADAACRLLGLERHRIGVCGLNPHAGEGGLIGTEDRDVIAPAVERARRQGFDVAGPLAADTLFHKALHGAFDAVVAQYHDQGLGPLKLVAFDSGVNWTLGLPFPRTSPDHGPAHDIAGRGIARAGSMLNAIRLAARVASNYPPRSPA